MESTFGLARNGWCSALLSRTFGLGSALLAADAAAGSQKSGHDRSLNSVEASSRGEALNLHCTACTGE